jgi:type 1 fimbria pilin
MAQPTFAQGGYIDAQGKFVGVSTRARDIIASNGVSAENHILNVNIHLTNTQANLISGAIQRGERGAADGVAPLGPDRKIPAEYLNISLTDCSGIVTDYAALLALTAEDAPHKSTVLVQDASADSTVSSGWAMYFRVSENSEAGDWLKLTEGESLDIDFSQFIHAADTALAEGQRLDAVYCADEEDMAAKNLRPGAIVFMAAENAPDDTPEE